MFYNYWAPTTSPHLLTAYYHVSHVHPSQQALLFAVAVCYNGFTLRVKMRQPLISEPLWVNKCQTTSSLVKSKKGNTFLS